MLASDSAANGPPAPPAVNSAFTASNASLNWGRANESSGGNIHRAESRPNASAAIRPTILQLLQFFLLAACLALASQFDSPLLRSANRPLRAVWPDRLSIVLGATRVN